MSHIQELQAQRADAEAWFQEAMTVISHGHFKHELMASALGYHREVCALYAAEISLIGNGTLPPPTPPTTTELNDRTL